MHVWVNECACVGELLGAYMCVVLEKIPCTQPRTQALPEREGPGYERLHAPMQCIGVYTESPYKVEHINRVYIYLVYSWASYNNSDYTYLRVWAGQPF